MDFFVTAAAERVDRDSAPRKVNTLMNGQRRSAALAPETRGLRCRSNDPISSA